MIGGHLTSRLLDLGHAVRATDIKDFSLWWQIDPRAESIEKVDLTKQSSSLWMLFRTWDGDRWQNNIDIVFNLAASIGGIGFITNENFAANIIYENTMIDANVLFAAINAGVKKFFYSSSTCVMPMYRMMETSYEPLTEEDVYPADCNGGYGWTKLHTEHLLLAHRHQIEVYIARFTNCYGSHCNWNDGKEKVPAAICRKIATAKTNGESSIEVWGDGEQERGFMYVGDCVRAITDLVETDHHEPITLGPERSMSINDLVAIVSKIAGHSVIVNHIDGPQGVRSRHFDHGRRIGLGLTVGTSVESGIQHLYSWIEREVEKSL